MQGYFDFLRAHLVKDNLFYCCNREEKIMPGGEVSKILDYPWNMQDRHLVDEPCPWVKFYVSWHTTKNGLKVFNKRVPLVNYFDGAVRHRLSVLKIFF